MLMSTCGIIAEYNPFHTGHAYQIAQAKKQSGADNVIVIMSGDFVQRGAPAIMDKYERAKMAIHAGADLVIMLPVCASTGSAESFADAAIAGLHSCGIVDSVSFGCEDPAIVSDHFFALARALSHESAEFQQTLDTELRSGVSYAAARSHAIRKCYLSFVSEDDLALLEKPNNLLAFSYMQAIAKMNCRFHLYPIQRQGMAYHETALTDMTRLASASACRSLLLSTAGAASSELETLLCPNDQKRIISYGTNYCFLSEDDCSPQLYYALLLSKAAGYQAYNDCNEDLSNRIRNLLPKYQDFRQFAMLLKNKSVSYTRVCRVLIHILLQIKDAESPSLLSENALPYLRILACNEKGRTLLGKIKRSGKAPLLTKLSDTSELSTDGQFFFAQDLFAGEVYQSLVFDKCGVHLPSDYARKL